MWPQRSALLLLLPATHHRCASRSQTIEGMFIDEQITRAYLCRLSLWQTLVLATRWHAGGRANRDDWLWKSITVVFQHDHTCTVTVGTIMLALCEVSSSTPGVHQPAKRESVRRSLLGEYGLLCTHCWLLRVVALAGSGFNHSLYALLVVIRSIHALLIVAGGSTVRDVTYSTHPRVSLMQSLQLCCELFVQHVLVLAAWHPAPSLHIKPRHALACYCSKNK